MTKNGTTKIAFMVFASMMAMAILADAPRKRHLLYGRVTVDGNPVADGVPVSAEIEGVGVETTEVFTSVEGSVYSIDVPGDIPETRRGWTRGRRHHPARGQRRGA